MKSKVAAVIAVLWLGEIGLRQVLAVPIISANFIFTKSFTEKAGRRLCLEKLYR